MVWGMNSGTRKNASLNMHHDLSDPTGTGFMTELKAKQFGLMTEPKTKALSQVETNHLVEPHSPAAATPPP
jgi:hypothetical protein